MSAERETFKKMQALHEEYVERGVPLVREALREFMEDHPEVAELSLPLCWVALRGEEGLYTGESLEEKNPKLSVCLKALKKNIHLHPEAFSRVIPDYIQVTHENVEEIIREA